MTPATDHVVPTPGAGGAELRLGAPAERGAPQLRQDPTTLDQLTRKSGQFGEITNRRAVPDVRDGLVDRRQRRSGIGLHDRNRPRQQHGAGSRGRARDDPEETCG